MTLSEQRRAVRSRRTSLVLAAALLAAPAPLLASYVSGAQAAEPTAQSCAAVVAANPDEPPCNPYLADSPWTGSHRNPYAQDSSPFPGPTGPADRVGVAHAAVGAVPVVLSFSPTYPDGKRVIWASTVGVTGEVIKVDPETVTVIDKYIPQLEAGAPPVQPGVSGAYNLVDSQNRVFVPAGTTLQVFGDAVPGQRRSAIALLKEFTLPPEALCGDDKVVGIAMTYTGRIAFATQHGVVGTLPRDPALMDAAHLRTYSINGSDCAGGAGGIEDVSNSIAVDENNGIYVVTSHAMYRFADGVDGPTPVWRSGYAGAGLTGSGRISGGSGSTPTLMGVRQDDRFVVITDGARTMNLVLMWRDKIPTGWTPVRPGADRRIACEVPLVFGNEPGTESLSEQSVVVRGKTAVVVNNLQGFDEVLSQLPGQLSIYTALVSGLPLNAPKGVERVDWNPVTRRCDVVWANPTASIPNGIPTLSTASKMVYGIGVHGGVWSLDGLDLATGRLTLSVPTTALPTSNSTYAGATIGPDQTIWTGTFGGITRFRQCAVGQVCEKPGPIEPLLGRFPSEPTDLLRHVLGLPN
ncbi:MAG: hypothetical protein NTV23_00330 [Propionibacteriales bacterium]|nr:hypothetical protein [Propionibacteriales bacterium]